MWSIAACFAKHHKWSNTIIIQQKEEKEIIRKDSIYTFMFSPLIKFCKTSIQSADLIRISPVLLALMCVCAYMCLCVYQVLTTCITCVGSCFHHHSQDPRQFQHHRDPWVDLLQPNSTLS